MKNKETEDLIKQIKSVDFNLIAEFLNENFSSFSSYCEERDPDIDADQIVSILENIINRI